MKLFIKENTQEDNYQLLGRLVSDCKYYLGGGYGAEKHLWAKSVEDQIAKMKEIYNSLDVKPEWLTMQDIEHYEKEMKKVKSGKNESLYNRTIKEQKADIEVENPGILEVPEGKNVEDLPIKHFVDIANRKGLSTVTRALNNLQVWNKNKNKSLSKWAGDMIDKVSKRFENQKKNESLSRLNEATLQDWQNILVEEVYNVLSNNNIYADVYEDSNFTDNNSFVLCAEITDGDWKHEHRRADIIISDLLDNYDNISVTKMKEEVTSDSEDDTYSSIHKYKIIKSDDMTEDCCDEDILNEFSSNFADTEFDEIEFYSDTLRDVPTNKIATTIETGCDFDINIYDVEIDTMGTMIISYEVREEDYNPDVIESTIISILERMEDKMRESFNPRNYKESYDIEFDTEAIPEDERYEYIKSKTVLDSDGWRTDYTMYYDWEDDKYIFIFGDNDLYDPTNESPDWECDTEAQANNWFDNYTGFDEEEDFDECYLSETNNNTEEQELAEFLDWLKQEKIRVTDVNKKFKMIHIQNPDDLDMASWYLHDRDYFKKLSDFGWMVSAPSPAGRKVAKALKMESKQLNEDEVQEFPNEVTVQIRKYSDRSGTYVKSRIIPNVVRIEDTDNYFYICTADDYCYEYAKDSLYDGSYRYTILNLNESKQLKENGIEDFDQYVGCEATFDGDIDDIKFYFTNTEFREIKDYIGSDGDIIDLGGPNDCCGVIRFSDGATFTVPFDFLEILNLNESKQLNEDETSDIENALQNFIDYNSNKNLDRIQKRIACTTEFDNGHVIHGDWQRIPVIDAELIAKEKSLKNPDKTYYVQYDDLMIGSSDLQWKNGQFKTW